MSPRPTRRIALPAVTAMAALVLSGCSGEVYESAPTDTVYCVDADNTIVDEAQCDDVDPTASPNPNGGGGGGSGLLAWFLIGRYAGGLQPGTTLDPSMSTSRVAAGDAGARRAAGLAETGRISNGISASTGRPASIGRGPGSDGKPGGFGNGNGTGG